MHILFLGRNSEIHQEIIKSLNCKSSLISYTSSVKRNHRYIYDRLHYFSEADGLLGWKEMILLINKIEKIDLIFTVEDDLQIFVSKISKLLGISYTYSEKSLNLLSNKYDMRKYLKENNFEAIDCKKVKDSLDIDKFLSIYPEAILKPIDGSGSKNIYKLDKTEFLERKEELQPILIEKDFIIEEYIKGNEYSVESYSENGIHKIYSITEKVKNNNFVEIGHLVPARITENDAQNIIHHVNEFLNIIEIENGPCHTEIILSKKGPKIVESQARFGGDMINNLYNLSYKEDIIKKIGKGLYFHNNIDQIKKFSFKNQSSSAIKFLPPQKGQVKNIKLNYNALNNKEVISYKIWCGEGDILSGEMESSGRLAQLIAVGNTPDEAIINAEKYLNEGITISIDHI